MRTTRRAPAVDTQPAADLPCWQPAPGRGAV